MCADDDVLLAKSGFGSAKDADDVLCRARLCNAGVCVCGGPGLELLEISRERRFQFQGCESARNVRGGGVISGGAGESSFELVAGEPGDVAKDCRRVGNR